MRLVTLLVLGLCLLLCLQWTHGDSSNPFEQLATGALSMGNQLLNRLQDGQMVQPQMNFDTPLLAVHSKSQLGFGNAMRRKGQSDDDDDSSSSEERRRRRSLSHAHHRGKRAPCFKMMSSATTTEASDDVEARKKRAQKRAAANNAARSRIVKKVKNKKKKLHSRRRRQAQAQAQAQDQQKLGPTVGDRIKGLWLAFVDNVVDMAQQMRDKVKAAAAQTPSGGN